MGPIPDAFARLGDWLRARPHRLTVVNALLLTGILVMIGNGDLFRFVGGAAVAMCAGVFAIRSVRQMERQRGAFFPYDITMLWAPNLRRSPRRNSQTSSRPVMYREAAVSEHRELVRAKTQDYVRQVEEAPRQATIAAGASGK
ncbi:hypothetical protein [Xanthobacter autotrophicus]|uniref:hypothetical protein n=1 Tax=Xanthobacter autotrophicus TaxID=280 RepID=UPI003729381E